MVKFFLCNSFSQKAASKPRTFFFSPHCGHRQKSAAGNRAAGIAKKSAAGIP
jgi:hypothetical protein